MELAGRLKYKGPRNLKLAFEMKRWLEYVWYLGKEARCAERAKKAFACGDREEAQRQLERLVAHAAKRVRMIAVMTVISEGTDLGQMTPRYQMVGGSGIEESQGRQRLGRETFTVPDVQERARELVKKGFSVPKTLFAIESVEEWLFLEEAPQGHGFDGQPVEPFKTVFERSVREGTLQGKANTCVQAGWVHMRSAWSQLIEGLATHGIIPPASAKGTRATAFGGSGAGQAAFKALLSPDLHTLAEVLHEDRPEPFREAA